MKFGRNVTKALMLVITGVAVQCFCLVLNSEEPAARSPAAPREHKWFVEVGPFWRAGGDVHVRVKSLPPIPHRPSVTVKGGAGPADQVADRQYDDGYVKMDYGTGVWDTDTWYWGYDSGGQISGGEIAFHASTYSARGNEVSPRSNFSFDLDDEVGGQAKIGRNVFGFNRMTGSVVLGLGFTSFSGGGGFEDLGYVWSAKSSTITDTYDLPGGPAPAPGYRGTKDGPGPLISNLPASRKTSGGGGEGSPLAEIYHRVNGTVDTDLWVLSLGLDVRGKGGKVTYVVGAGLSGNFVGADYNGQWAAVENGAILDSEAYSGDDDTFELGVYGEAGVLFELSERWSLSLRARYDYLFDDAEVDFPHATVDIDLSGVSGLAMLGFVF